MVGELLPHETCFLQQWNLWFINDIFLAWKNLKLWELNQPWCFEQDMKWLKTTAYENLSGNLAEKPPHFNQA